MQRKVERRDRDNGITTNIEPPPEFAISPHNIPPIH